MAGSALGMIETKGLAAVIAAVDVMLDSTEIDLVARIGGESGYHTAIVRGTIGAVRTALDDGRNAARKHGTNVLSNLIGKPHPDLMRLWSPDHDTVPGGVPHKAIGCIETIGLLPVIAAADAALKSADIVLLGREDTGSSYVMLKIAGNPADVEEAVRAGSRAAARAGKVMATLVMPRISHGTRKFLDGPDTSASPAAISVDLPAPKKRPASAPSRTSAAPQPAVEKSREKKILKTTEDPDAELVVPAPEAATDVKMEFVRRIGSIPVSKLRRLARSTSGFRIQGREISFANRNRILEEFRYVLRLEETAQP